MMVNAKARQRGVGLMIATGALVSGPVWAQVQVAPSRAEVEIGKPEDRAQPSRVTIDSRSAIQAGPCPLRGSQVTIDLKSVRFETLDGQPVPNEFVPLLAQVKPSTLGAQSIDIVCDLRDAANAVLRSDGYIAGVQVPAQDVTSGDLRFTVIAGRITDVTVRGDVGRYRDSLRPRIEQLKALFPLNQRDVERILLLAGDVPGLDVNLGLKNAGTTPGELSADLNVDATSMVLLSNVQNPGSRQLGREIGTLRAEFYGLTGMADLSFVSFSNSFDFDEQHILQVGHEVELSASGLRLGVRGNFAQSQPDIEGLNLKTQSIIAGVDFKFPFVRRVRQSLSGGIGFEYVNQRTKTFAGGNGVPFSRDRISVAYARIDGSARSLRSDGSSNWTLDGGIELRKGLGIFGNTPLRMVVDNFAASRFDGDSEATVVRGTLDGTLRFSKAVSLTGSVFGQWANNALLNIEEFSIGNLTYGRGYDPGANGADRTIAFRIEPRVRMVDTDRIKVELSTFYDNIRIWNLDNGTLENKRTLESIGGGVRVMADNRFILDLTYAKPLKLALASAERRPTDRLLISLTTKLLPWRAGR
jgi:hemolysin activation/secretion protein